MVVKVLLRRTKLQAKGYRVVRVPWLGQTPSHQKVGPRAAAVQDEAGNMLQLWPEGVVPCLGVRNAEEVLEQEPARLPAPPLPDTPGADQVGHGAWPALGVWE